MSLHDGLTLETCGVDTTVAFNRCYIRDFEGENNSATSGVIFKLESGYKPEVGILVKLSREVSEFIQDSAVKGNLSLTNITFPDLLDSDTGYE